jgi:hypothetical protein
MKTRLLKKFRKKYDYYFDTLFDGEFCIRIMNREKMDAARYDSIRALLMDYATEELGFWTGSKYAQRLYRRDRMRSFYLNKKTCISPQLIENQIL